MKHRIIRAILLILVLIKTLHLHGNELPHYSDNHLKNLTDQLLWKDALDYCTQQLEKKSISKEARAFYYLERSVILYELYDFISARQSALEALQITPELSDSNQIIQIRIQLADSYYQLGDFGKVIEYLQGSLEYARKHKAPELQRHALTLLGSLYLINNDYTEALKHLKQASDIAEKYQIHRHRSKNTLLLALGHLANSRPDSAAFFIQKGIDAAATPPDSIRLTYA